MKAIIRQVLIDCSKEVGDPDRIQARVDVLTNRSIAISEKRINGRNGFGVNFSEEVKTKVASVLNKMKNDIEAELEAA